MFGTNQNLWKSMFVYPFKWLSQWPIKVVSKCIKYRNLICKLSFSSCHYWHVIIKLSRHLTFSCTCKWQVSVFARCKDTQNGWAVSAPGWESLPWNTCYLFLHLEMHYRIAFVAKWIWINSNSYERAVQNAMASQCHISRPGINGSSFVTTAWQILGMEAMKCLDVLHDLILIL